MAGCAIKGRYDNSLADPLHLTHITHALYMESSKDPGFKLSFRRESDDGSFSSFHADLYQGIP